MLIGEKMNESVAQSHKLLFSKITKIQLVVLDLLTVQI